MNKNIFYLSLLILLISSCTTPIGLINKNPKKYDGKKVRVYGKVISSLQLRDIMCFTMKMREEKICVVTQNYLPITGAHITVRGVVKNNYEYDGRNLLVIEEKLKKAKKYKTWKKTPNPVLDK